MEKFIPYEKRSKKEQRRWNNARRGGWGAVKPVTRAPKNSRAYDRRKAQNWKREAPDSVPFVLNFPAQCRRMGVNRLRRRMFRGILHLQAKPEFILLENAV